MAAETKFGSCCEELKEAIEGGDFEPLITVGPDTVIYMTVGLVDLEDDEPGLVDHPLFFCPFCGTKLQTPEEVRAKVGSGDEDDDADGDDDEGEAETETDKTV